MDAGPGSCPGMPGNDRLNPRASFHKMLTNATPLIIPQIGTVYQVLATAAEALLLPVPSRLCPLTTS